MNSASSAYDLDDDDWVYQEKDVWKLAPSWIDESFLAAGSAMIGCLGHDPRLRSRSKTHRVYTWSSSIPEGSLYDLGNDVLVSSPCFTYLQMASQLNLVELIAYGFELCGYYAFDETSPRGMRTRNAPLCTVRQISQCLEAAKGCRGYDMAQRAIKFIVDGSASPMETLDTMLLCLPYRLGGYGIPYPIMNLEIPLDKHARRIAKRSSCRADMCYLAISLDIEHHGEYDHDDRESFDSDRARVNGLKAMGFEVIELTAGQVGNIFAFEEIASYIAKRLRKRIKREALGATQARLELRNTLFSWSKRYGHPK